MRKRGISKIYLYPSIFLIACVGLASFRLISARWGAQHDLPPVVTVIPEPATLPTSLPAIETPSAPERPFVDLLDVVLDADPNYPTTQPLDLPADLHDAAKIVLDTPVYFDALGRLWITHPKGQSIADILRKPIKSRILIVNEAVLYVHYPLNQPKPTVFVPFFEGGIQRLTDSGRESILLPETIRLFRATRFGTDGVIAPYADGATIITPTEIRNIPLREKPINDAPPLDVAILSTGDSAVIWAPADGDSDGSPLAVYIDAKQTRPLTSETGWFDKPIQFIILADGSILGVGKTADGIELKLTSFDKPPVKSPQQIEKIESTARRLADRDPRIREKAQLDLEAMGPGIYPELDALREKLPAEAQVRIEIILGQRFAPTLGGLKPLPGMVQTVSRFSDGGCVLRLTGGGVVRNDAEDQTIIPAWIAIRPGQYIQRLPDAMVEGFVPGKYQFFTFANEWVIFDPVLGVRRWIGAKYETLLPKPLRHFDTFVGIDAQNRWIFRSSSQIGKTLIIDPSLPDSTPRLPVWTMDAPDGAGWTDTAWPALKRGKQVFVLGEKNWRLIDDKTEKFDHVAPKVLQTTVQTPHQVRYELLNNRVTKNGATVIDNAMDANSLYWAENYLFLVGTGQVHRFSADGKPEATFTKNLPTFDPTRAWIDPAGRLIFTSDTMLWIAFPTGRIPPAIKSLMLVQPEDED